ncbi:MAG TPA: nucleotidyl transferase AbiEii/AbiGii toxin family protein [Candidatus Marinimicrobia bacterium]|nr:nucleotidyl transferase AbiEii/AbiGii toxin family protein [Candidatus Neomarinimicrobiota bacterium]HRS52570.1 nucleotidyl transferase AbiEii/AbiGii toxin family protein [Candidatus Neomarinimicrobiota bacterium]HRU93261.1 nucleotidyl transferase AbiEii/AbiGii toxin family protein [Candidatus Neomarinimicrobiota bacterium]
MKSQARTIIQDAATPHQAQLLLREYLQHLILRQLFEQKILQKWIFHGGTALRMIYGANRFSEDLDFHLLAPETDFSLINPVKKLCKQLALQGYRISEPRIDNKIVQSVFIRFEDLLYEFGLSPNSNSKLSIKIELDTSPPDGFQYEKKLVNRYFPYSVNVHNLPTFLSGKIHALLQRPYTKGRDYYDLIFILSRWQDITPNITYLQNALNQTNYQGEKITLNNWRKILAEIGENTDWNAVIRDIEPFLESKADLQFLTLENLLSVLK